MRLRDLKPALPVHRPRWILQNGSLQLCLLRRRAPRCSKSFRTVGNPLQTHERSLQNQILALAAVRAAMCGVTDRRVRQPEHLRDHLQLLLQPVQADWQPRERLVPGPQGDGRGRGAVAGGGCVYRGGSASAGSGEEPCASTPNHAEWTTATTSCPCTTPSSISTPMRVPISCEALLRSTDVRIRHFPCPCVRTCYDFDCSGKW